MEIADSTSISDTVCCISTKLRIFVTSIIPAAVYCSYYLLYFCTWCWF